MGKDFPLARPFSIVMMRILAVVTIKMIKFSRTFSLQIWHKQEQDVCFCMYVEMPDMVLSDPESKFFCVAEFWLVTVSLSRPRTFFFGARLYGWVAQCVNSYGIDSVER